MSRALERIVVVGQGYVGLPLAVAAAESGFHVVGVDTDQSRILGLTQGTSPVSDVSDSRLAEVLRCGRYRADATFDAVEEADVVVLCVPTPYHNEAPDLSYVTSAGAEVGKRLRPEALVILESTTYPGTTEEVLQPVLEAASGLRAGVDFELVFSPERIDPGNPTFGLHNTPKIVGGLTEQGTLRAVDFYGRFVERVIPVSGPKAAEMAKLLENTFRHINIALVNELAILCQDLDVDVWEVIDAAASKPFGFMPFYPGPGVGGHCIPVDPMYLSWRVRQFGGSAKFIELARDVNAAMPTYCVTRIQEILNDAGKAVRDARILLLGVAYKPNVGDMRESPALPLIERLWQKRAQVDYHDSFVPSLRIGDRELSSVALDPGAIGAYDCVVIVTNHDGVDYGAVCDAAQAVFDTRNALGGRRPHIHRL